MFKNTYSIFKYICFVQGEIDEFKSRWMDFLLKGDPYYNKNLSCDTEQYNIKTYKVE